MRKLFCLVFTAATLSAQPKLSKQEQITRRLDKIEEQNRRILETQEEISKILKEADAPPPPVKVDITGAPALGEENAPVTIVEFTDMQCPYCNKFHTDTFPELHDKLIATGKVRFVSRDLPLPMHKNALQAAEAGRCAGEQGHYWEMRDWMQSNPEKLELSDLTSQAQEINLDVEQYHSCMSEGKYRAAVNADAKKAQEMGISGTPTFVIGKSGATIEGSLITGAQPLVAFEKAISALK